MPAYTLKVSGEDAKQRIDIFLTKNIPGLPSRSFVQKLIENGQVKVNQSPVKSHYKVLLKDTVEISWEDNQFAPKDIKPENISLDIFYEDSFLIAINKPSGMLVHPTPTSLTGTLVNALFYHYHQFAEFPDSLRAGIVHRLDKETSGLLLVAKDHKTHLHLSKQFEQHKIKKKYVALAEGIIEYDEGVIEAPLGRHRVHFDKISVQFDEEAKEAETFYRVLKRFRKTTLVELSPRTGRTHQLRVHMAYLGHPILGDQKYGKKSSFLRLALHAKAIGFFHPKTKAYLEFSSQIPKEFLSQQSLL